MRQRFPHNPTSMPRSPWYSVALGLLAGGFAILLVFELADMLSDIDWG